MKRAWALFQEFFQFLTGGSSAQTVPKVNYQQLAGSMNAELRAMRDATALAGALADQAHEELEKALGEIDTLEREARECLALGNEADARNRLARAQEKKDLLPPLTERYERVRADSNARQGQFHEKQETTRERLRQIPQIMADQRLLKAQEEIASLDEKTSGDTQVVEDARRDIDLRMRQLQRAQTLSIDTQGADDRRVRETLQSAKVDDALARLKQQVSGGNGTVVEAEFSDVVPEDPIGRARKALAEGQPHHLELPGTPVKVRVGR